MVRKTINYIESQPEHHKRLDFNAEIRAICEESGFSYHPDDLNRSLGYRRSATAQLRSLSRWRGAAVGPTAIAMGYRDIARPALDGE